MIYSIPIYVLIFGNVANLQEVLSHLFQYPEGGNNAVRVFVLWNTPSRSEIIIVLQIKIAVLYRILLLRNNMEFLTGQIYV